jgi:hypothetical protein
MVYRYISDAKVNEILDRRPHNLLDRLKGEKSNITLTSPGGPFIPTISFQREFTENPRRFPRLTGALELLYKNKLVGSIDQPAAYFYGDTMLRRVNFKSSKNDLVFFGGVADQVLVAMGGSARHLLGNSGDGTHFPEEEAPILWKILLRDKSASEPESLDLTEMDELDKLMSQLVGITTFEHHCRFVARKEGFAPFDRIQPYFQQSLRAKWNNAAIVRILLGSPLYVEEVDTRVFSR